MMHMTFYWGRDVTLLLDSWKTKTWTEYSLTLLACFLFSAFYQYMEDRRIRFKQLQLSSSSTSTTAASPPSSVATSPLLYSKLASGGGRWILGKFAGSALFGINAAIGYLLMLAVMSYNGGVFIAIVLGLSFGYSLFRNSDEDVLVVDNPCGCA